MGEFVHSQQVQFSRAHVSCGVLEVHHLPDQSGSKLAFAVVTALYHKANPRPATWVLFSDTVDSGRGRRLAAFVKETLKEDVVRFGPTVNPKTGNVIEMWVWSLEHDRLRKWYQDELANRVEESLQG